MGVSNLFGTGLVVPLVEESMQHEFEVTCIVFFKL